MKVQVDEGASLDLTAFTVVTQKIGSITVDMAKGGGTILGGAAAESGTLYITNSSSGFTPNSRMPLALQGIGDRTNLKNWSVVVDGTSKSYHIALDSDGEHFYVIPPGLTIVVR